MKRSILRHYIGNRDEMVDALAERVVAKYQADTQGWVESLAADTLINDLLDFFLSRAAAIVGGDHPRGRSLDRHGRPLSERSSADAGLCRGPRSPDIPRTAQGLSRGELAPMLGRRLRRRLHLL